MVIHAYADEKIMLMMRRVIGLASVLVLAASAVDAQEKYPNKPIRMLVGFTAGSGTDFLARTIGQKMSESWAQQVVVDNRPGAGGVIASEILARATPDGYTLIIVSNGHAVNASLFSKLPYDTLRDFAGVTYLADVPNVLFATSSLGLKSVRDLIELVKSKPKQVNYGSAGMGTAGHMNTELFNFAAGIKVVHIPFKGAPEALTNTIGGSVQYGFLPIPVVAPLVKAGKVTGLAVSTKNRTPVLPEMPTVAEGGIPGFDFSGWYGMFAPAKTPHDVKDQLAKEIARIFALQDVNERLLTQGATPHPTSPEELDAFIKEEVARMGKLIRDAGIRVE